MASLEASGPNAGQNEFWNGPAGDSWTTFIESQDRMLHPLGGAAMAAAEIAPGHSIIDIGCGCGPPPSNWRAAPARRAMCSASIYPRRCWNAPASGRQPKKTVRSICKTAMRLLINSHHNPSTGSFRVLA